MCNTHTHVEGLNCMTNPRRTNSTRRNKLRARVLREETICWLCGEAVNTSLQAGLPQSPEVDEILPVSLGGDPYDRSNVRLAHRLCLTATKNAETSYQMRQSKQQKRELYYKNHYENRANGNNRGQKM